jgi:hypothetical protein
MRIRGFTVVELVVSVAIVAVTIVILVHSQNHARTLVRLSDDKWNVRTVAISFSLWAGHHHDKYPLPSEIDTDNATVSEVGRAKDTTANILSLMVDSCALVGNDLISPLEPNEKISKLESYEFDQPAAAVDPTNARWDPILRADFTSHEGGHVSYAHLIPVGKRLDMWKSTGNSEEAIVSNRGPQFAWSNRERGTVTSAFSDLSSLVLRASGGAKPTRFWSGHIAYNDLRVEMHDELYTHNKEVGTSSDHRTLTGTEDHDVLFADEEGFETNLFLGIFTSAGETKEDYTAIWD